MEEESRFGKLKAAIGVLLVIGFVVFVFSVMASAMNTQREVMTDTYENVDSYSAIATQASKGEGSVTASEPAPSGGQAEEKKHVWEKDEEETSSSNVVVSATNAARDGMGQTANLYSDALNGEGPAADAEASIIEFLLSPINDFVKSKNLLGNGLFGLFGPVLILFLIFVLATEGRNLFGKISSSDKSKNRGGSGRQRPSGDRPSGESHSRRRE